MMFERREAGRVEAEGLLDPEQLSIADVAVVMPELALVLARRDRRRIDQLFFQIFLDLCGNQNFTARSC